MREAPAVQPLLVGRYAVYDSIAAGGMATVHFGQLLGPVGFSRVVAIKRLHPHLARDPEFVSGFLDEARLAARIRHPNVVPTLDIVATKGELFVVMEYVEGESLGRLIRSFAERGDRIPPRIVASILSGTLQGLHAAHEAVDEQGRNLDVVHRDVSPQNILVGSDGTARVLDFGIAKAVGRGQTTREGHLKGKLAYMSPEQFKRHNVTRRVDVYAASVVLWETLTCTRLFKEDTEAAVLARILVGEISKPSELVAELAPFDAVVMKGLSARPEDRFETAREMALAVEQCVGSASSAEVAEWLERTAGPALRARAQTIVAIETASESTGDPALKEHLAAIARGDSVPPVRPLPITSTPVGPPIGEPAARTVSVDPSVEPGAASASRTDASSSLSLPIADALVGARRGARAATIGVLSALALVLVTLAVGTWVSRRAASLPTESRPAAPTASEARPVVVEPIPPPVDATPRAIAPAPSASALPPAPSRALVGAHDTGPHTAIPATSSRPKSRFDALGGRE